MEQVSEKSLLTKSGPEVRVVERVRLEGFHDLLPESETRVRCPGKHPPVLLEDLLKAEILSLQLVLAMENIADAVISLFGKPQDDTKQHGALEGLQTAFSQGGNALNKLTSLQISDSVTSDTVTESCTANSVITKSTSYPTSMSFTSSEGTVPNDGIPPDKAVRKRLMFDNATLPTPWKPKWTSSTSDEPRNDGCGRNSDVEETKMKEIVKESVKELHEEIKELQVKHEKQFVAFAGKYWNEEDQNMKSLLGRIVENLSPQDQNWTYHGKFDDHCMEQLFYFVSLQKTLKNCSAILDAINLDHVTDDVTDSMDVEIQQNRVTVRDGMTEDLDIKLNNLGICGQRTDYINNEPVMATKANDILPKTNGKRSSIHENEPEAKKRKKSRGLFACFNTKWSKRRVKKY